jgi:hypothetical protein
MIPEEKLKPVNTQLGRAVEILQALYFACETEDYHVPDKHVLHEILYTVIEAIEESKLLYHEDVKEHPVN